jgi:chromosome segregation ATPase
LWQAAVGVQLDDLTRLRSEAQAVADGARDALAEAQLRTEVLKQELAELRAADSDRESRLAQAQTDGVAMKEQLAALRLELQAAQQREAQWLAERAAIERQQADAVAAAQARYEGLSKQLMQETAQQRQAGQAELGRLVTQQKFAEKREAALQGRLEHMDAELVEARAQREQAAGEVSALRYVNASLRAQIDEVMRTLPPPKAARPPGLARGRKRNAEAPATKRVRPKPGT